MFNASRWAHGSVFCVVSWAAFAVSAGVLVATMSGCRSAPAVDRGVGGSFVTPTATSLQVDSGRLAVHVRVRGEVWSEQVMVVVEERAGDSSLSTTELEMNCVSSPGLLECFGELDVESGDCETWTLLSLLVLDGDSGGSYRYLDDVTVHMSPGQGS